MIITANAILNRLNSHDELWILLNNYKNFNSKELVKVLNENSIMKIACKNKNIEIVKLLSNYGHFTEQCLIDTSFEIIQFILQKYDFDTNGLIINLIEKKETELLKKLENYISDDIILYYYNYIVDYL